MVKEKKEKLMTIRISNDDYVLFQYATKMLGSTPSKSVRQFVDTCINAVKIEQQRGNLTNEDIKTFLNN